MASVPQYPLGDVPEHPLDDPPPQSFPEFSATDPALDDPNYYPTSDGRPMGETDLHRQEMVEGIETLTMHYAGQQVYVSGNILLYYKPGNRRRHVSPDLLVAKGLSPDPRENYLVWNEGPAPQRATRLASGTAGQRGAVLRSGDGPHPPSMRGSAQSSGSGAQEGGNRAEESGSGTPQGGDGGEARAHRQAESGTGTPAPAQGARRASRTRVIAIRPQEWTR